MFTIESTRERRIRGVVVRAVVVAALALGGAFAVAGTAHAERRLSVDQEGAAPAADECMPSPNPLWHQYNLQWTTWTAFADLYRSQGDYQRAAQADVTVANLLLQRNGEPIMLGC